MQPEFQWVPKLDSQGRHSQSFLILSVAAGLMFLLCIFIGPIITFVAAEATGPALIITATLLIPFLRHLRFDRYEEVLPALITMIVIPFSYSIGNGAAFG